MNEGYATNRSNTEVTAPDFHGDRHPDMVRMTHRNLLEDFILFLLQAHLKVAMSVRPVEQGNLDHLLAYTSGAIHV